MSMEKADFIKSFEEITSASLRYTIFSAFVNCLNPEETCEVLDLSFRQDLYKRRAILRKLNNDLSQTFETFHKNLLNKMLEALPSLSYPKRESCARFINATYDNLPDVEKERVLIIFLKSRTKSLRDRAYKRLLYEWKSHVQDIFLDAWNTYKDNTCAGVIIKNFPEQFILNNFEDLRQMCSQSELREMFKRLAAINSTKLEILRAEDPITYVYIMVKLGKTITQEEITSIYKKCQSDDRIGLFIWCIGQMKNWNALDYIYTLTRDSDKFDSL